MHLRGQCPSFPGDALGCWHLSGWNFHRHHISHVAPKNWSFEVVFVIAPQKRRQGIDIDGSIPAGFFLSIFLLAIQASLLYLGWSVFHFRIFTFCQVINMKISPQWLLVSRIHNNDLDQRHRFLWVSSSTCNLGLEVYAREQMSVGEWNLRLSIGLQRQLLHEPRCGVTCLKCTSFCTPDRNSMILYKYYKYIQVWLLFHVVSMYPKFRYGKDMIGIETHTNIWHTYVIHHTNNKSIHAVYATIFHNSSLKVSLWSQKLSTSPGWRSWSRSCVMRSGDRVPKSPDRPRRLLGSVRMWPGL